jgi:DNA-binding response OmpR family regulator
MQHNKILIVDDEPALREMVQSHLTAAGYIVTAAANCTKALQLLDTFVPDAAILDVMLPDGDGFALFSSFRQRMPSLPVLFLSARDEDEARLRGLGLGADDYITKPFLLAELRLRLAAVLRRVYGSEAGSPFCKPARLGSVEIDWDSATVQCPGKPPQALTAKEYMLLKKLWENRGRIVTVDALCAALWQGELIGYENTLMVHIRHLREKIEPDPSHPLYLLTVRGLGYQLAKEADHGCTDF